MSAVYEATAYRDNVEVHVSVKMPGDVHQDVYDHVAEEVGSEAGAVLANVHEKIAAVELRQDNDDPRFPVAG